MLLSKKQAAAELARRSLCNFARVNQPTLCMTAFHRSYYEVLDRFARGEIQRLIISVPPQHGKSLGSSIFLPAYLLGMNPDTKIALASYNLRLASRFNRKIQRLMTDNMYQTIFPQTQLKTSPTQHPNVIRTSDEFELVGAAGGLLSVGREGALTGNPVDVFILDDLYKDALEANSPLIRDNTWEWYNAVVKTRLHNLSRELIVFTRWHEDDLIGRLNTHEEVVALTDLHLTTSDQADGKWFHLNFEAIKQGPPTSIDPRTEGTALWPERHSLHLLEQKRRLDPILFETMYQGHPTVREGLLYGDHFSTYTHLPEETVKRANYTDTADTGKDYLCSVCYEVGRDGILYITDVVYTPQGMEETEVLVAEMLVRNHTAIARIESNNGGRGFARDVAKRCKEVRVEWFHQSHNKEARILSNAPAVMNRIAMPEGWQVRWSNLHSDLVTFRRLFRANRRDDAADVLTGIIETESDTITRKNIRAVGFKR